MQSQKQNRVLPDCVREPHCCPLCISVTPSGFREVRSASSISIAMTPAIFVAADAPALSISIDLKSGRGGAASGFDSIEYGVNLRHHCKLQRLEIPVR